MTLHSTTPAARVRITAAACALAVAGLAAAAHARPINLRQPLAATGADGNARGEGKLNVRARPTGLSGKFEVKARLLTPGTTYQITVDGVAIGSFTTMPAGMGRARFNTSPHGHDQLLGVDPRGRTVAVVDPSGAVVLMASMPTTGQTGGSNVRCCLPDGGGDGGAECEDRTSAECAAQGGVDLGAGSCLPNPCEGSVPPPAGSDIRCCLPDDSGPECEDRTPEECAAQGGVNIGAGSCTPNPCAPTQPSPDADVRCCLPDDSGPECEDRTAAECTALGGVNIGAGPCLPDNPCLSGATTTTTTVPGGTSTTTTTLPGGGAGVALVTCERRSNRSKYSVNGSNLASGSYRARATSGANVATAGPASTVGDQVELDFDSDPGDIAAGATPIAATFIQGATPQVTGEILDASGAVIASATATCRDR